MKKNDTKKFTENNINNYINTNEKFDNMIMKMELKDMKEELMNLKQYIKNYIKEIIPEFIKQYDNELRKEMEYKEYKYFDSKTKKDITRKIYINSPNTILT